VCLRRGYASRSAQLFQVRESPAVLQRSLAAPLGLRPRAVTGLDIVGVPGRGSHGQYNARQPAARPANVAPGGWLTRGNGGGDYLRPGGGRFRNGVPHPPTSGCRRAFDQDE